jgi:hypothetical protein
MRFVRQPPLAMANIRRPPPTKEAVLLLSQRNAVFSLVVEVGLDPTQFEWKRSSSRKTADLVVSRLHLRDTRYFFLFDFHRGQHYAIYSPGEDRLEAEDYPGPWELQLEYVRRWLASLKTEIESPDLWAAITEPSGLVAAVADTGDDNGPFTHAERARIASSLEEIKQYLLSTQTQTSEQRAFVNARLDYLESAAHRLGRKDWITLALGVMTNIVIGVALNPEAAREMFRLAGQVLAWLQRAPHLLS